MLIEPRGHPETTAVNVDYDRKYPCYDPDGSKAHDPSGASGTALWGTAPPSPAGGALTGPRHEPDVHRIMGQNMAFNIREPGVLQH